jgi:tetratricopeptide (TPR) repeat protein
VSDEAQARGIALLDRNRPDLALADLRRAIAGAPEDAYSHALLANALMRLGDHAAALEAATTAAGLHPDHPWPHQLRAITLGQLGRTREAREAAEQAVRLWPEWPDGLAVLAHALQADGDEAGALAAAEHAVRVAPEDADAAEMLGDVLFRHKRWRDAELAYERALSLDPESATAHNNLAVARLRQGRGAEGLEGLERAVRANPSLEVVHHNLEQVGRRSTAATLAWIPYVLCALFGATGVSVIGDSGDGGEGDFWTGAIMVVASVLVALGVRRVVRGKRPLSAASATLVDDRRRARRWRPWRWDWSTVTSLRPGVFVLLARLRPRQAFAVNVVAFAGAFAAEPKHPLTIVLALGRPGSAVRLLRYEQRKHPAAGSWRPPAG